MNMQRSPRLAYLDGWRGLAILLVLLGHDGPFGDQINFGPFGVELFFVLSGRLMADLLFVRKTELWTFFKRRFFRIFPTLFVFLTVMFAISSLSLFAPMANQIDPVQYLSGLFFFSNYWSASGHEVDWVAQIWSLSVEEHCYIIIAVISAAIAFSRPKGVAIYGGIAVLCMAWGAWCAIVLGQQGHQLYWRTDVRAASVLLSAAIYLMMRQRVLAMTQWLAWLSPIALFLSVIPHFNIFPEWTRYTISTALLAISINVLDVSHPAVRSVLSWRPLTIVGLASYSIYLWQQPFYMMHTSWSSPVALAGVAICASVSFLLIERPARVYLNRRFGREPATATGYPPHNPAGSASAPQSDYLPSGSPARAQLHQPESMYQKLGASPVHLPSRP